MSVDSLLAAGYQALLGMAATLGFAVWFNVPRDQLLRTVVVGTLGFLVRWALLEDGRSPATASFWAAFFIGTAAYATARFSLQPRVTYTIPSVIPLVPGIPAYESLVRFFHRDISGGLDYAVRATLVIGALAGGLTAARAITMKRARFE